MDILAIVVPRRSEGSPSYTQCTMLERRVPITSGYYIRDRVLLESQVFFLRDCAQAHLLTQTYLSGLHCGDGSSKSTRNKRGGTELTTFKVRTEGAGVTAAFSRDRSAGRHQLLLC